MPCRLRLAVSIVTALSACGPAHVTQPWTKPGFTESAWRVDSLSAGAGPS